MGLRIVLLDPDLLFGLIHGKNVPPTGFGWKSDLPDDTKFVGVSESIDHAFAFVAQSAAWPPVEPEGAAIPVIPVTVTTFKLTD